ncbi:MAG: regulator [Proteobacteria bacterium]|nr:regulator [Pseudomonadota bacterium]
MDAAASKARPKLWTSGDMNAFFGLFTNVLLNVLVLSSLCLGVAKLPNDIVFGRILPALGIALPIGNLYYAWLAYRRGMADGRNDVAALPYGPSVPQMFIVTFVVMLPTYIATNDAILGWKLGLIWAMIVGLITLCGILVGPAIRKYTPRAAMLGTLAGVSIAFISMRPAFLIFDTAWIGLICFMIVLVSWVGRVRLPFGLPGGLVIIVLGGAMAWTGVFMGWTDIMKPAQVSGSLNLVSLHLPMFSFDVFSVPMEKVWPLLVTAIPLGIYNFTEAMNNVESAAAGGDEYDLRYVLFADGLGGVVGALLGSPFPPAVYIGHPGWKAMGGRVGYSLFTGIFVSIVCFFGLAAFLLSVVPLVAILPILLFIGLVIGAQAFQACPRRHAPAIVLALVPNIAEWARGQISGTLSAAGVSTHPIPPDTIKALANNGVVYHGMELAGGGAVLAGLMLGAIAVFVIDRRFNWAAVFSLFAAALSYFGFINGSHLALNASPAVSAAYFMAFLLFSFLSWRQLKDGEGISWAPIDNNEESLVHQ